jgi:signal transduction histidine kinase/ligand-binding sensor domain-containing protein/CheY-like chemotaxis protein
VTPVYHSDKRIKMMKKLVLILFLSYSIWHTFNIQSQTYRFTHISSKEGLPHNYVFSIIQDRQGFIWFGTNNGVARYDGYNFRIFQPSLDKSNKISDKSVYKLYCDLHGDLWMVIQGRGLNKINLKTEKFSYYFPNNLDDSSISGNYVKYLFEDRDSTLWICSNKGIDFYDRTNDRFIKRLPKGINEKTIPTNDINYLADDDSGHIWFLANEGSGIGRLNKTTGEVESLGKITGISHVDSIKIFGMIIDRFHYLWFCTEYDGLYCYNPANKRTNVYLSNYVNLRSLYCDKKGDLFIYADNPNNKLLVLTNDNYEKKVFDSYPFTYAPSKIAPPKFTEDQNNNIWICSLQGLKVFNKVTGLTDYRSNIYIPNSITGDQIETFFIDNTDDLWLSIYRGGIDKADLKQKRFHWYFSNPLEKSKCIAGNNIVSIFEDRKDNLWIGSYAAGLTIYNRKNDTYHTIPISLNDPTKLNSNAPATFFEDDDGTIWLGYYDGQLDKINPITLEIRHFSNAVSASDPNYFKGWAIRKILEDKDKNIWFASSSHGLIELERKTGKFIYHSSLYEKDYHLNSLYRTMFIDKDGIIWLGTQNGGLLGYDKSKHLFFGYKNNPDDQRSISSNTVYAIYKDSAGIMWIGTAEGLNRFESKTGKFTRLHVNESNEQYAVFSILPDKHGNFWMSSDNGLIKFNIKSSIYTNYYESDGLPSNEFNTTSSCLSRSGEMYLGTPNGLISFLPDEIESNPFEARPVITDFLIYNKSIAPGDSLDGRIVLKEQLWATKEIVLYHYENDFILEFSALHYAAPEKIRYSYKLEGFNQDWVDVSSKRRWAVFTGLQPGNYIFRLKATNNDGLICDPKNNIELKIIIKPPFWKNWWFRPLILLFIIAWVLQYIKNRIRKLKKQKMLLEQKVKERTKELEESNAMLEERQEEINLQKEELMTQKDILEDTNSILLDQKQQIIEQNKELDRHRNELEQLVSERTRELEQAMKRAEQSDRLKSAFLANMSHEIRTPMNSIVGFSGLLRDEELKNEDKHSYVDIIIHSCESLLVIIDDILDLSKIQANQLILNYKPVNLNTLLNKLYETFLLETNKNNLKFSLSHKILPTKIWIESDEIRLTQILSNLIGNAIKFTDTGSIEFGIAEQQKNMIVFFVKDTGIGIPPEIGNSIFEIFSKIKSDRTKQIQGAGLGLAISKGLIKLMGGEIWYESKPEQGTIFLFSLPLNIVKYVKPPDRQINNPIIQIPDLSGKTILIAEDEENNYKLIVAFLKKTNATILWAKNGTETIELFQKNPFIDLILMDIKMPLMDGVEANKKIKQIKKEVIVVAQTAFAYENDFKEFIESGFDAYIPKPIKIDELFDVLQKFLI